MQARCSASNLESLSRWSVYFSRFSNRVKVKCAKKMKLCSSLLEIRLSLFKSARSCKYLDVYFSASVLFTTIYQVFYRFVSVK